MFEVSLSHKLRGRDVQKGKKEKKEGKRLLRSSRRYSHLSLPWNDLLSMLHSNGLFPGVFKGRILSQEPRVVTLPSIFFVFQDTWVPILVPSLCFFA